MKPTVVKFPPDHDNRLRRLGIKKQFMRNVAAHKDLEDYAYWTRSVRDPLSWGEFIAAAFPWRQTPEGWEFWKGIANYKTRK